MTSGQQRALRELERLSATDPNTFELVDKPYLEDGWLISKVCLNLGPMEMKEDGLDLREREEFILRVPPGFPFDRKYFTGPGFTFGRQIFVFVIQ